MYIVSILGLFVSLALILYCIKHALEKFINSNRAFCYVLFPLSVIFTVELLCEMLF